MVKFLGSIKENFLLSKTSKYFQIGCSFLKKLIAMEEKNIDSTNSYEPPGKKLCVDNTEVDKSNQQKVKRRNVALLMAYNGAKYYGMQVNCEFTTIESKLLHALHKADLIPLNAVNDLHLIHFQRAARTDKGVSAAKQIVSFKIAENFNIENINSHLPEDIRVFSIKRVTKGFNSKNQCFGRTYSYTLPSFALAPEIHTDYPENYRIDQETIQKVNDILCQFLGTHAFHNFTSKKDGRDPSAKRYILTFKTEEPFVDREEFITLKVKGQSFMLHQIRKMIGFVIAVMKGLVSESIQTKVWTTAKLSVPMVPGHGLVLEDIHYDKYNLKFGNDGMHSPLVWDEVKEELKEFRKKFILAKIIETEISEKLMFQWIQNLPKHKFEFSDSKELPTENDDLKDDLMRDKNCDSYSLEAK